MIEDHELPPFPARDPNGHKGTFGKVLVVAGSRGMSGAAILAGLGALRGGAGLVTVACPDCIVDVVAGYEPSYLTLPLPSDVEGKIAQGAWSQLHDRHFDAIAIGPGLGQSDFLAELVHQFLTTSRVPIVIDADGLNLLARRPELLRERPGPTLLTPHLAEFARLTGRTLDELRQDPALLFQFAAKCQVTVALKRPRLVVTDGSRFQENRPGNPGMATGGTGDVLTGLALALLGQGMSVYDAGRLAGHLHGRAGDLVAWERGEVSLIARDLIDTLPRAIREHTDQCA